DSLRTRLPHYALFNLNYRLVNGGTLFPSQEEDIKAAIDAIVAKAGDYAINSEKISLLGFSAGAHLALLQAYKKPSPRINAVIDYFGPTDLVTMYQKPWHPLVPMALQMVTGQSIQTGKAILEASSPARFVTSQSPPTLILHGGKDAVVDVSQSRLLAQKLEANGVLHELHLYPAEGHGRWYGQALQSSFDRIGHSMRILFILIFSMNINSSCKQKPHSIAQEKALPAQTFLNVAYGSDSLQKMDIYLPANRRSESTKSLVLIHGGGWTSGSKSDFAGYIDSLRNRLPRYAIFNINYRLAAAGTNLFPTQENDVEAAINFIHDHLCCFVSSISRIYQCINVYQFLFTGKVSHSSSS
ncbi:MAG: alpha/beta hydrolase, partial [Sphingobacteriales bacterium]